jgi:UDP-GlcNAc:undecaprenyl-phosphate/decaprenyl-phosphate GlcNAc-1-phosphate transferase
VVAKRIKYRRPIYRADTGTYTTASRTSGSRRVGPSPTCTAGRSRWGALALALRFVPYSDDHGHVDLEWTLVMLGFAVLTLLASVYVLYVLEIFKFRGFRERQLRRHVETGETPALTEEQIAREIAREVDTGEFEAVPRPGTDEFEALRRK